MWKKDSSVTAERVPGAMAAYRESVDEFSKHATEFLASTEEGSRSYERVGPADDCDRL